MHLTAIPLTKDGFEQNLNTKFWLRQADDSREPLDLVEVRNGHSTARYKSFSLLFRGSSGQMNPQRTYAVEHDSMGAFELFLVPVARETDGMIYEAVFNQLISDPT